MNNTEIHICDDHCYAPAGKYWAACGNSVVLTSKGLRQIEIGAWYGSTCRLAVERHIRARLERDTKRGRHPGK